MSLQGSFVCLLLVAAHMPPILRRLIPPAGKKPQQEHKVRLCEVENNK